jgi:hypothetical protein
MTLGAFEWKILRRICGPIQENTEWRTCYNNDIYGLFKDTDVATHIKMRRLGEA